MAHQAKGVSMNSTQPEKPMERPEKLRVHIRWMIRRDMTEVLEIENGSFARAWREEDFIECLRGHNCIGNVAEYQGRVIGFCIYELHKHYLEVLNFAVHLKARRRGVGRSMIDRLIDKLSSYRRTRLLLNVRETNLDAQLFFKACGLKAKVILQNEYDDTDEDAYQFTYRYKPSL
jgi:ribosomal-protein-alanine N-acetyltransferase